MRYLTEQELLILHARIVDQTGGSHGVRDIGLFKSILQKPKLTSSGKEMYNSIFLKASVYFESIAQFHVFVDGNKRTAITATAHFLEINGFIITKKEGELEPFVMKAVIEKWDIKQIADWLEKNSERL